MLKWILLAGWALWLLLSFLIVDFPNAAWNHLASYAVLILGIAMVMITLAVPIFLLGRIGARSLSRGAEAEAAMLRPLANFVRQKNRWMVVRGCIVLVITFVSALLGVIENSFKSSLVYKTAVSRAEASPEVIKSLGQPIHEGWVTSGEITESSNSGGRAVLNIPLRGPRGNGKLRVQAREVGSKWQVFALRFERSKDDAGIDLLQERITSTPSP